MGRIKSAQWQLWDWWSCSCSYNSDVSSFIFCSVTSPELPRAVMDGLRRAEQQLNGPESRNRAPSGGKYDPDEVRRSLTKLAVKLLVRQLQTKQFRWHLQRQRCLSQSSVLDLTLTRGDVHMWLLSCWMEF